MGTTVRVIALGLIIGASAGCSGTAQPGAEPGGAGSGGSTTPTGAAGTGGASGGGGTTSAGGSGGSPGAAGGTAVAGTSGAAGGASGGASGGAAGGASGGGSAGGKGGAVGSGGASGGVSGGGGAAGAGHGPLTNRAGSIPVGIENVNDSPLKAAGSRALIRFVPDATISIDRVYFGFKLRGASCWDSGNAGYGAGDGGTLHASLVNIDPATGLPSTEITSESVNGCTRQNEAALLVGSDPVMVWVNTVATLQAGKLYGLIVSNAHQDPAGNFFSFNMPLADTMLAGPHARNELDANATGGILGLDPREHVAWSKDAGKTWDYGSLNGQYRSYMNDHDAAHPATRMPQYGFRLAGGKMLGAQPYYAYSTDCVNCSVTYANAHYARAFSEVGGFTASGTDVGTLTLTNTTTGEHGSCTPTKGYGFRKCALPTPVNVAVGQSYTVAGTGSVEVMRLDNPQRVMFPGVGTTAGELRMFQAKAGAATNAKDIPNLWAGPLSASFPAPGDP
jgi:hypothetical protein